MCIPVFCLGSLLGVVFKKLLGGDTHPLNFRNSFHSRSPVSAFLGSQLSGGCGGDVSLRPAAHCAGAEAAAAPERPFYGLDRPPLPTAPKARRVPGGLETASQPPDGGVERVGGSAHHRIGPSQ